MKEKNREWAAISQQISHPKVQAILEEFYGNYLNAVQQGGTETSQAHQLLEKLISLVAQAIKTPYTFDLFHRHVRQPFDYYQFSLDFIRPLIDFSHSKVLGTDNINHMLDQLARGENVILLANHQTEPDPQIIHLMLDPLHPGKTEDMIFVAGHRVTTDPMAIPMSMGCNLLCIYSKKHMDHPPEEKPLKVLHNQRTMQKMKDLLEEGGKWIYVAPSGGRDRADEKGFIDVAPFDAQSLEMFWLMAQQATPKTHFYPLALYTYHVLPPPGRVEKEIGEKRKTSYSPVFLHFGPEIDMENFPGSQDLSKKDRRQKRAEYIGNLVKQQYHGLLKQE